MMATLRSAAVHPRRLLSSAAGKAGDHNKIKNKMPRENSFAVRIIL